MRLRIGRDRRRRMMMTQATMTTSKLSLVAGAALMLAAFPALAQTNTQSGNMGGTSTTAPGGSYNSNPGMAPRSSMGSSSGGMHDYSQGQDTHHGMSPHHAMRSGRSDSSQNAAIDRLNEQSLQAAQQGQNFMPGSTAGGSAAPASDNMGQGGMGQGGGMSPPGGMSQPGGGMSGQSGGKM